MAGISIDYGRSYIEIKIAPLFPLKPGMPKWDVCPIISKYFNGLELEMPFSEGTIMAGWFYTRP
jgi:hypothetical protein